MLTQYFRSLNDTSLEKVSDYRPGVWVHAENPSPEEITELASSLTLDEGLLTDATDLFEVPRFEYEEKVAYLFTRHIVVSDGETTTAPLLIAVGPGFVVTTCRSTPAFIHKLIDSEKTPPTTHKSKLFIDIMFASTRGFTNALVTIRREVRRNRRNIKEIRNKDIIRFVSLEDTLNDFISALVPTNTALQTMLSGNYLELYEDDEDLVEDLLLAGTQVIESARSTEQTIMNIRSTYNSIITHNLNQVIKVLTALTIILTIPTIIGSMYGMNIRLPGADHPQAFWFVILATALISGSITYLFVRREWF